MGIIEVKEKDKLKMTRKKIMKKRIIIVGDSLQNRNSYEGPLFNKQSVPLFPSFEVRESYPL